MTRPARRDFALILLTIAVSLLHPLPLRADDLEFTRWSGKLNVPDPVAIAFDGNGTAYVTQTQRRKSQDLDIRQHKEWIADDVSFQSVSDKRSFYHTHLAIGNDEANRRHVDDHNADGHYDYRDLMVISEIIHRVQDVDGDGTADSISRFATGFQSEVTGIAAGVLEFDGSVYATIAPDVWKLTDSDQDGRSDQRELIATGFGLHIAYAGHDMHGLTVGPDGKIYWSIGDKGISVKSSDGRKFHYPNQGGVMRCNPDGSDFEVFAHGLRNVQELAFDQHGNLFGVDNDADKPTEKERFVYIVQGMDAGWRCNYQYRGNDYDPWMNEKLWLPYNDEQPAYLIPPIQNYHDGPAGFAFNPGTALDSRYHNYFFLTSAPKGDQWAFKVREDGASFRMEDSHQIGQGIPLVGINFGPDGALYGVDWGGGYPLNQSGAIWKIDAPESSLSRIRQQVKTQLDTPMDDIDEAELISFLESPDQRVRLKGQFELARRSSVTILSSIASSTKQSLAPYHAVWGLGQIARNRKTSTESRRQAIDTIVAALTSNDSELVVQALKTLRDLPDSMPPGVTDLLRHRSPRVRFAAATALGAGSDQSAFQSLVDYGMTLERHDTYSRFALVRGFRSVAAEELATLSSHENEIVRLAAVVALRRKAAPEVVQFLSDDLSSVRNETAMAIHDDFSIPEALPDLAGLLDDAPQASESTIRRSVNANFRSGTKQDASRLARFANNEQADSTMRVLALKSLRQWYSPPPLDLVTGRYRDFSDSNRTIDTDELQQLFSAIATSDDREIRSEAMYASASLKLKLRTETLVAVAESEASHPENRVAAMQTLESQRYTRLESVAAKAMKGAQPTVRIAALAILGRLKPQQTAKQVARVLESSDDLQERQHAVALLTDSHSDETQTLLKSLIAGIARREHPELWLEISDAVNENSEPAPQLVSMLEGALAKVRQDRKWTPFEEIEPYIQCRSGGNAQRGKEIFDTHLEGQCIRCHRVGKKGSNVGPELGDIGKRRNVSTLLRSIVAPSAEIEEKYRTQVVVLESGKSVQGVVANRTAKELTLLDGRGQMVVIDVTEIEEAFEQRVSIMPDMRKALSPKEIRDLLAYLRTLRGK